MRETTSSFPQLKAEKTAGQISACTKAPVLGSPTARTVSTTIIPDISNWEEGTEKGTRNLFTLDKNGKYVHSLECISRGHRQENNFGNSLLKT